MNTLLQADSEIEQKSKDGERQPLPARGNAVRAYLARFYAGLWSDLAEPLSGNGKIWMRVFRCGLIAVTIFLSALVLRHTLATNDGPVHLAFAHRLLIAHEPGHPLQDMVYTSQLRPDPNLAVYLLMMALMRIVSPGFAESLVQVLCIAAPIAAGYFALSMVKRKNAWLAMFLVPMVLNQSLFWGLYNHCLSASAFFLAIGTYVWMRKAPSLVRALLLWGALVLTFFCHAGGFIMAFGGVGVMCATSALLAYRHHRRLFPALKPQVYGLAALVAMLPMPALFLASGGKSVTAYDFRFIWRVKEFVQLHVLAMNFPTRDRFAAAAISLILLTGFVMVGVRVYRNRQGFSVERRDQAIGAVAAALMAITIMLAFPDTMGGGWTHFRRFEIFPYFWILLILAFDDFSRRAIAGLVAVSTSAGVFLIGSMMIRQHTIREQMAPMAEVDRIVGDHCTVVPLALGYTPVEWGGPAWMEYQPFFQPASRLELHGDRVVLFNYLARLGPYPVHFRPQFEPQEHMFLWKPAQQKTSIRQVDVQGYERESGLPVDYVLVWENFDKKSGPVRQQILAQTAQYTVIYKSQDGRVKLYQRPHALNSLCQVHLSGPGTSLATNSQ